jgi:uncharacterized protein YcfJ
MKPILASAMLATLMCAGCATTQYRPLVDSGVSRGNYEDDVADCQNLADRRPVAAHAAGGAAFGAFMGALFGLAVGLRGDDVAHVAAWGAASGGIDGAAYGAAEQEAIVSRCMAGRGYDIVAN